jgi:hypothetical protein
VTPSALAKLRDHARLHEDNFGCRLCLFWQAILRLDPELAAVALGLWGECLWTARDLHT